MKIRTDFVTNSSSSSFILSYKTKEEGLASLVNQMVNDARIAVVINDFNRAGALTSDEFKKILDEEADDYAYYALTLGKDGWWSSNKPTFENKWLKEHPGQEISDMMRSEEYQKAKSDIKKEYIRKILDKIAPDSYIVSLEYGSECGSGEYEWEVLPNIKGVVATFNHH